MNLFTVAFLIIVLPFFAQIILGFMIVFKRINLNFALFCFVNLFAQIMCIIVALKIIAFDTHKQNIHCGMPQTAMVFLGIASMILVAVTSLIQMGIWRYKKRRFK